MNLENWRKEIDRIDLEMLNLLHKRTEIAIEIGKAKTLAGLPLVDKNREALIITQVLRKRREPLSVEAVSCFFNCIIQQSRRVQFEYLTDFKERKETEFKLR